MISVLKLFWKIFTKQFYILNAGFFLLCFILMFGIIHPPEIILVHTLLIRGIINSNVFTWIIILLWITYNLKCILFCLRIIRREDNTMLFNLQAVTFAKQVVLLFICHCTLYLPVLIYSGFVIYLAGEDGFKLYAGGLVVCQLMMCVTGVCIYYTSINQTWKMRKAYKLTFPEIKILDPKTGLAGYLLSYTFHSRKLVFFVLKLSGIFLLQIILSSGKVDFELRDFILVFMIVVLIHAVLIFFYVTFVEKSLSFFRNLPLSRWTMFLSFLITYLVILLPELCLIIFNTDGLIELDTVIVFYGIAIAELLLFTSILYLKSMKMKPYLQRVFGIYLTVSILMLSGRYVEIFLTMIILAIIIFYKNYYAYEEEL